nr:hypothetical protein BdHM001_11790 [Bdellovibrio sp. HM001]
MKKISFSFLLAALASPVFAGVLPEYAEPELLVRVHLLDTYNLPPLTYLSNTSPAINNHGDVAIKLMAVDGKPNQAIWFKAHNAPGEVIYVAPDDHYVTDPTVNDRGQVTFSPFNDFESQGVLAYDSHSKNTELKVSGPENQIAYAGYAQTLNDGTVIFRNFGKDYDRSFVEYKDSYVTIAREGERRFDTPAAYLFRPAVNEKKQWAFKVRLGEHGEISDAQSDQILLIQAKGNGDYEKTIIAQDRKGDPNSNFVGFGNTVALSQNGMVVFIGHLPDKRKSLVLYKDGELQSLVTEGLDGISELELFTPRLNSSGTVAFRAKNTKGLRGLYVANEFSVKRLLGEGDSIMTDKGFGYVLLKKDFPGFAGDIDFNEKGELAFACILASPDDKIIGDAIYKLSPK